MRDLLMSFATVFVAEIGDKSQLMVVAMAAVLPRRVVLLGVVLSAAVSQTLSVTVGGVVGDVVSDTAALLVSGIVFIAFGLWAAVDDHDEEVSERRRGSGVGVVAATIFLSELGDKTMFATASLAATASPVAIWVGSFAALVTSAGIALVAGDRLLASISAKHVRSATVLVFVIVGLALLVAGATK